MSWEERLKTFLDHLIETRGAAFNPPRQEKEPAAGAGEKNDNLQIPVWLWHMF